MKIGNREIGPGYPYIIAECSGNHLSKIEHAIDLIEYAKWAGADAVKFQAYTPDTLTLNCRKPDFIVQEGLWKGQTLYELYKKTYTPWDWFPRLFGHAIRKGIIPFASVFDKSSVDMLEELGCAAYKIASFEIVDTPLIAYAAKTGKPLIISTGLANEQEILDANEASGGGAAFLHCTSDYPGTVDWADLRRINRIDRLLEFHNVVGISDHTAEPALVPCLAVALGATIIEKHIKLPDDTSSEDASFSLTPDDFKHMVGGVKVAYEALTERSNKGNSSRQLRRSLYAVDNIKAGETITEENIRSIRPGYGIAPKHLPRLLGRKADRDYRKGDRIS